MENRTKTKVVIDTKYYKRTLVTHFEKEQIRQTHLNQICIYLKNLEAKGGINLDSTGVLLYPETTEGEGIRAGYTNMLGHKVVVTTINLNQHWKLIHNDLIELIDKI